LRYWDRKGRDGPFRDYDAPASIVLELPLPELAPFLPKQVAVKLYRLVRNLFSIPEKTPPRLAYRAGSARDIAAEAGDDLSLIILELPLSELARLLPQRLAVRLCNPGNALPAQRSLPFPVPLPIWSATVACSA
jgi:hypothetical protein